MLKLLIPLIAVFILAGGGFYLYQTSRSKPAIQETALQKQISPSPTSPAASPQVSPAAAGPCEVLTKGSSDVPPLYKEGITWQQPTITEYEIPLAEGSQVMSGCLIRAKNTTDENSFKATGYYDDNLKTYEWEVLVSASGVYSSTDSYRKNKTYLVVRRYADPSTSRQDQSPSIITELFYSQ